MSSGREVAVSMRGIVKRFGETTALDGVDFELLPGEIHALLGENGAGKSTLMQVLSGLYSADAGSVRVRGQEVRFRSARDAAACGIGMVHQHFTLVENFTVAENLALALPAQTPFFLPRRGLAAGALELAAELGWRLEPEVPVWQLPVGVQQRIEIVKVLAQDPEILIFDEPTAVLAPVELDELFAVLDRLRSRGKALVFISHKLNEVMRLCDRISVLARGRNAGTMAAAATSPAELARRMVGASAAARSEIEPEPRAPLPPDRTPDRRPVLRLRDLYARDERGLDAVRGLSLDVCAGEVLGVAGVDGNGQAELAEAAVGLRAARGAPETAARGAPETDPGQPVQFLADGPNGPARDLRSARREIGYIPQDRRRSGLVPGMSVRDNLILELLPEPQARWGPWLRWGFLNREAAEMSERYDVRASGLAQHADTLSGGNQQKIVIARALHKQPRLLVALNPTRGLDVNATAYVHEQLRQERARGAAILLISTELDEVIALSDRIAVLYEGQVVDTVSPDTPREALGLMMGGHRPGVESRAQAETRAGAEGRAGSHGA